MGWARGARTMGSASHGIFGFWHWGRNGAGSIDPGRGVGWAVSWADAVLGLSNVVTVHIARAVSTMRLLCVCTYLANGPA